MAGTTAKPLTNEELPELEQLALEEKEIEGAANLMDASNQNDLNIKGLRDDLGEIDEALKYSGKNAHLYAHATEVS